MKLSTRVAAISLPLAFASQAIAGDYHTGTGLICSDCHIMHYSQSHGYDAPGTQTYLGGAGPYSYLLRDTINDLCLSCHDNSVNGPDVLDVDTGMYSGTVDSRSAGFLNRQGGAGTDSTGHTLDSTDTAPGSNPAWNNANGLACTDCHAQHGIATQYRNLLLDPGNAASEPVLYAVGTNDLVNADVFERVAGGDNGGAGQGYDESNVDWNEPNTSASAIADWCKGCHTNFHGAVGGAEVGGSLATGSFLRHPAAEVNLGGIGGNHSNLGTWAAAGAKVKVMDPGGTWDNTSTDVTPTCISCHKAHGNGNAFGLIYRDPDDLVTDITENGSTNGTQYEHLCKQCHAQASAF